VGGMPFCPKCGAQADTGASFCSKCGTSLRKIPSESAIPLSTKEKGAVDQVLDIVNAIMIARFPSIRELIRSYKFLNEWEQFLPITMGILRHQ
jgi:predicted amidophosphoribosyltransferase